MSIVEAMRFDIFWSTFLIVVLCGTVVAFLVGALLSAIDPTPDAKPRRNRAGAKRQEFAHAAGNPTSWQETKQPRGSRFQPAGSVDAGSQHQPPHVRQGFADRLASEGTDWPGLSGNALTCADFDLADDVVADNPLTNVQDTLVADDDDEIGVSGCDSFGLALLVEGIAESFAAQAHNKGIEIALSIGLDIPDTIIADAERLRLVLTELVGDAIACTTNGGVGIKVSRPSADTLHFSVTDTRDDTQSVFSEGIMQFLQDDSSDTQDDDERRSGQNFVGALVKRMGGTLTLETPQGKGVIFSFTLPLRVGGEDVTESPFIRSQRLAGHSILVVTAAAFTGTFLCECLEEAGAVTRHATTENEADAFLSHKDLRFRPDGLIVDMDFGAAVARSLITLAHDAQVQRTLLMFSSRERQIWRGGLVEGFDGWLIKPVRNKSLFRCLDYDRAERDESAARTISHTRVLLAEDNDISAFLTVRYLESLGLETVRARDGLTAFDHFLRSLNHQQVPFAAAFIDMHLPDLDASESIRHMRQAEQAAQCTEPCFLVAMGTEEMKAAAMEAGFDRFAVKPLLFQQVQDILRPLLPHDATVDDTVITTLAGAQIANPERQLATPPALHMGNERRTGTLQ
ncbi:ATP-binding protein [Beijerinckia mobilis]|uniref:ATP-binding protein n=1 Tax=Beijerinckia mobilis TaxID=231434 RepID=UPI000558D8F6|nr:ATP-binding protein [Beijerinckia mobilis]